MDISFSVVSTWKERWDHVMNDADFRIALTGKADYTCNSRTGFGSSKKSPESAGTIYISDKNIGDQGHFIAYKKNANKTVVFDPAPTEGTFGAWADEKVIGHIEKFTKRPVHLEGYHTQHHVDDSFCATWSLAWLMPSLKPLTKNVTNDKSGMHNIFEICKRISERSEFPEHVLRIFESERVAHNFLKRTHEWLSLPFDKSPFKKIFTG